MKTRLFRERLLSICAQMQIVASMKNYEVQSRALEKLFDKLFILCQDAQNIVHLFYDSSLRNGGRIRQFFCCPRDIDDLYVHIMIESYDDVNYFIFMDIDFT